MSTNTPTALMPEPEPRKLGRPSLLDDTMIAKLAKYVRDGNYYCVAAQLAGISDSCLKQWLARGQEDFQSGIDSPFLHLVTTIKRAEAEAEAEMVQVITSAAKDKKEWLPATVYLERRHRERWGRPAPVPVESGSTYNTQYNILISEGGKELLKKVIEGERT